MKNVVIFLAIGLLAFSLVVVVGVAQASRVSSNSSLLDQSTQVVNPSQSTATASPQVIDVISPDQAGQFVIQPVGFGESVAITPVLVSFEGKIAYEVTLNGGFKAYVDAVTGALLYNPFTGDTTATISSDQAVQTASQYLNSNSVYGWGIVLYKQAPVYAVGFNNGDIILVNPHGQVIYVQQANASSPGKQASNNP